MGCVLQHQHKVQGNRFYALNIIDVNETAIQMNQELHKEIKTIDEGTHNLSQFFEIKPCKIDIDALLFILKAT